MIGRTLWIGETDLEQRFQVPGFKFHVCQRIRRVMHLAAANAAWIAGERECATGLPNTQ